MAYSESVLRRARERLELARSEAQDESERRIRGIYQDYPRLREIDLAMKATVAEAVAAAFRTGEDPTAAVEDARKKNLALQEERSWLLQANDLEEADLEPDTFCPHCGGRGYVGEAMCECLRELCRQEQKKELSSLLGGRENFDGFRLDYYPEEYDENIGASPRMVMERVFRRCRQYAREFSVQSPSLLFTGATGLGKTFLSACIARTAAESGHSVVYDTAMTLFADFEAAKFGGEEAEKAQTAKYLACDLLIIDDLGTEMTTQFTQSALYNVVNTRLVRRLPTIISTNLTTRELQSRYLQQTASRLLGAYERMTFVGRDIRLLKK